MSLLGTFAATAMLLAALGLYGVISYAVLQRTREFGVRTALGASPGEVALLVARQASWLVLIGLAIGMVMARVGTRFLASQLFGVRPDAGGPYLVVAGLLALIAGAAVIVPALRAAAVDPVEALRAD
jgi:putative ABC transport system permease protein